MLGGDAHDASHVGGAGLGEFLCTTRDKVLKPGRRRVHQHSQRLVARIPERMHHAPWREDRRADRHFGPDIVLEELRAPLEHKKPFILVQVIMQRLASARWSDIGKHGILAASFRGTKMNGDLVAKSPNDSAARGWNDAGGRIGLFIHFVFVRGTTRSWPVRPGKYAQANISRKLCRAARAAAPAGAVARIRGASLREDRLTCWPETVQAIATRVRARRTAPSAVNFEETTKVRTRS